VRTCVTKFTTYKKSTSKKGGEIGEYKISTLIKSYRKTTVTSSNYTMRDKCERLKTNSQGWIRGYVLMILPQVHLRNGEWTAFRWFYLFFTMSDWLSYQQSARLYLRWQSTNRLSPTAILVCERHPIRIRIGLGCWLSIVTFYSLVTSPQRAKQNQLQRSSSHFFVNEDEKKFGTNRLLGTSSN